MDGAQKQDRGVVLVSPRVVVRVQQWFPLSGAELVFEEAGSLEALLDYEAMRGRVLKEFGYLADRSSIRLNLVNFYGGLGGPEIPVLQGANWTTLVGDMLERQCALVEVSVSTTGPLRQRRHRRKEAPVEFDSDGGLESAEDEAVGTALSLNTPSDPAYRGQAPVRCEFCHRTNRQARSVRQAGPFYGPFTAVNAYAHLLCLLWMSYVHLDDDLRLCNVDRALKFGASHTCSICRKKGASFYCHSQHCKEAAHYPCAVRVGWTFDWQTFTTFCPRESGGPRAASPRAASRPGRESQSR